MPKQSSLRAALEAAVTGEVKIKMAETVPNGEFVAVLDLPTNKVVVRRKSRGNAGDWLTEAEVAPNLVWRPI